MDLFKTASFLLKFDYVRTIMDQFSRRIIDFAVPPVSVEGEHHCMMLAEITSGKRASKRMNLNNDPLYRFNRWVKDLKTLKITSI